MPGEPDLWFDRFVSYRRMGPKRSIRRLWYETTDRDTEVYQKAPPDWYAYAKTGKWTARARAWDQYMRDQDEAEYMERRKKLRGDAYRLIDKMVQRVDKMLEHPLTRKVSKDGKTLIQPTNWRLGDAARITRAVRDLARLAGLMESAQGDALEMLESLPRELRERAASGDPKAITRVRTLLRRRK